MRSLAERRRLERLSRFAAFSLLAVALWSQVNAIGAVGAESIHADLGAGATPRVRDSLSALSRAGYRVTWSGVLEPLTIMTEPVRTPTGGVRSTILASRPSELRDDLGILDSIAAGGGSVAVHGIRGALIAISGGSSAGQVTSSSVGLGRVLVLGRVGWESKFVIAALEEDGWKVDARLALSDSLHAGQGALGATGAPGSRVHAAVVVLDPTIAVPASDLIRFVRAGGGLVLAGKGSGAAALAGIAPARVVGVVQPEDRSFAGRAPLDALPLHALRTTRSDAVVLDSRDSVPTLVARRERTGRVVQMGYADTWKWRMEGESGSVAEHREFWSRVVGMAARATIAPRELGADDPSLTAAPLAAMVHSLGFPTTTSVVVPPLPTRPPLWIGALILMLLLGEWTSRRMRGDS